MNSTDPSAFRSRTVILAGVFIAIMLGAAFLWRSKIPASVSGEGQRNISATQPVAPNSLPGSNPPPIQQASVVTQAEVPQKTLLQRLNALSSDGVQRQLDLDKISAGIPTSELERTLESIWEKSSSGSARELSQMLLRRWASEMPGVAAAWLTQKAESPLRNESSLAVATVWANRKVSDAAEWVRQWPEEQKEAGLLAVGYEASRKSPQEALWLASELPANDARDDLIRHAVSQWAGSDPEAPLAWAAKMEPSPLRDQVVENVSLALSETDPQGAATLALQSLPAGKRQNDVVVGIVQRWVQNEPERAAEWVAAFPEGQLRDTAVENLIALWADQSPRQAADWLGQLETGQGRDVAVSALSGKLASSSPSVAATWIESISNPERRLREMEMLGERWLAMDRKAASDWIETAGLPEDVKARLLTPAPAGKN